MNAFDIRFHPLITPALLDIAHLTVVTGIPFRAAALFLPVAEMDHQIPDIVGIILCKYSDPVSKIDQILSLCPEAGGTALTVHPCRPVLNPLHERSDYPVPVLDHAGHQQDDCNLVSVMHGFRDRKRIPGHGLTPQ
jgi:hypothetical protein